MYSVIPEKVGRIKKGIFADLIGVNGDPSKDIKLIRNVGFVMKDGVIYKSSASKAGR